MSKVKFKIIDGGKSIPIGNNLYKLIGRSHEEGGIGIELKDGNAKTIIEAEDNEIYEPKTHEFRIFSDSIKIGNKTPAQLAEAGYNPDIIFKAQQSINGNYGGSYGKDGLIKRLVNFITGNDKKENDETSVKKKPAEGEPINEKEVRLRQAYAESRFDSKAGSHAGARGLFQIMPSLLKDYNNAHGTNHTVDDLYNDEINTAIRDWKMNLNLNSAWATKNAAPDSIVYAKSLGGYNMGNQNFLDTLGVAKNLGVDIYNTLDWVDKKYLPVETVDYINFVLRNQDNSVFRNQAAYEASKKLNKDKVDILNNNFKNGGQINMKLKHKNKQDITDMVINEILPHSTGERKKFFTGGFWANIGANGLNSLLQGIVTPILNYKMADEIEKSGKDLQPVQMSKTYLDSRDHTLNNLLGDVDRTVNKFIDISSKNTNNSKTHMNRIRELLLNANAQKQDIVGKSLNRSDDIRRENARMAQEVDKINITNKNQFALVNEQNRLDRQAAAMSARMAGDKAILDSTANLLHGIGTAFYDYDKLGLSLLNSNNPKAWDFFNAHWGKNWK